MTEPENQTVDQIVAALEACRFVGRDEYALQDGIAETLIGLGQRFTKEATLDTLSRIDFVTDTGINRGCPSLVFEAMTPDQACETLGTHRGWP